MVVGYDEWGKEKFTHSKNTPLQSRILKQNKNNTEERNTLLNKEITLLTL